MKWDLWTLMNLKLNREIRGAIDCLGLPVAKKNKRDCINNTFSF